MRLTVFATDKCPLQRLLEPYDVQVLAVRLPKELDEAWPEGTQAVLLLGSTLDEETHTRIKQRAQSQKVLFAFASADETLLERAIMLSGIVRKSGYIAPQKALPTLPPSGLFDAEAEALSTEDIVTQANEIKRSLDTHPVESGFDALVLQLKATIKQLRDMHNVDEIRYNQAEGVSISRRQIIASNID